MSRRMPKSLQYVDAITALCSPLFEATKIKYFSHCVLKPNKGLIGVCTHAQFTELYFKKGYYNYDIHALNDTQSSQYILWDLLPLSGKTKDLDEDAKAMDMAHTFTIIKQIGETKECFHFSGNTANDSINGMYMQYAEFLENFILYYKEKINANNELSQIYQDYTKLDAIDSGYYLENANQTELVNPPSAGKFILDINQPGLSKREISCLYWLSQGKTMDEIALILHISHRTVRAHIENAKDKLQCQTLFQLGQLYHKLALWRLL